MGKKRIWAVGGGKGGVGKSLVATNLAVVLANLGSKVVAVDLDLGNANMHTYFGIRYPRNTLIDFINGKVQDLNEILLDTSIFNLKFISGAGGILGLANPGHTQKLSSSGISNASRSIISSSISEPGPHTTPSTFFSEPPIM